MKRLYVGGLGHTISQKDLKDRFGKFGEVSQVEIVTRKDEDGVPLKTFGYINIDCSEADFKRCMTVLNKSKWKGGTLQIEMAKESFLHRLAEERQQAAAKAQAPTVDHKEKIVESFKKAGVKNFQLKAAVPGTEIPGHKDWVVSKFGRVLPVLHLKCQGKNKYDPSKHCHNIKKLGSTDEILDFTPVSKLTWELSGGNDEISKKRRGEFPPQKARPKKIRKDLSCKVVTDLQAESNGKDMGSVNDTVNTIMVKNSIGENGLSVRGKKNPAMKKAQKVVRVFDGDDDSEDEIKMLVARELSRNTKETPEEDEDNLEVVGDDFTVKSNVLWAGDKNKGENGQPLIQSSKDDEEYDSADTDEILTMSKTPSGPAKQKEDELVASSLSQSVAKSSVSESNKCDVKSSKGKKKAVKCSPEPRPTPSESDDSGEESEDSMDSDYDAMMANCYRIDLSLADLEQLAKESSVTSDEETDSQAGPSVTKALLTSKTKEPPPQKSGNNPEDILAALLEGSSGDEESDGTKMEKKKNQLSESPLPAFMGTKGLFGTLHTAKSDISLKRQMDEVVFETTEGAKKQKHSPVTGTPKDLNFPSVPGDGKVKQIGSKISVDQTNGSERKESTMPSSRITELLKDLNQQSTIAAKLIEPQVNFLSSGGSSGEELESSEEEEDKEGSPKASEEVCSNPLKEGTVSARKAGYSYGSTSSKEELERGEKDDTVKATLIVSERICPKQLQESTKSAPQAFSSSSSSSEESESGKEEDEGKEKALPKATESVCSKQVQEKAKSVPQADSSSSSGSSSSGSSSEESDHSEEEDVKKVPRKAFENAGSKQLPQRPAISDAQKQQQDNLRRLAAVEQRQKEAEQQKKLIQGALSKVDTPNASKGKHVVFGSDDESDVEGAEPFPVVTPRKSLFQSGEGSGEEEPVAVEKPVKEPKRPGGSKLFDSDEDEDDAVDEERFQIKPQFEGKAGQKLMQLQSRFGTDERFHMDSRFLESDDEAEEPDDKSSQKTVEEELVQEKKKNLDILQSVLNINIQPSDASKESVKAKTFRDISALHYDPTCEEHAAFETKTEEPKKESKAARRKKREEAEKLPEVSKEMYYDVAVDLKQVFGATKENVDEKKDMAEDAWDEEEEEDEEEPTQTTDADTDVQLSFSSNVNEGKDEPTGFMFSFFGDPVANTTNKTEEYKIETMKGAKVSWQVDPRFQDSSTEEEDLEEEAKDQSASTDATEEPAPSKKAFFFYCDDERLKEGPGMFCRSTKLEDQREEWEGKRPSLIDEYRKKHKDARRRLKASQSL